MATEIYTPLPTLKREAKQLRAELAASGSPVTQAQALERVAHNHGARDWNTLSALSRRNAPDTPVMIGQRVRGRYLGQSFVADVIGLTDTGHNEQYRVTLHLDAPVDVVEFDSFSNFRQRVTCVIGADGVSPACRSDGTPHLDLLT